MGGPENPLVRIDTNILPKSKLVIVFCGLAFALLVCFIDQKQRRRRLTHDRKRSQLRNNRSLGGHIKLDSQYCLPSPLWPSVGYIGTEEYLSNCCCVAGYWGSPLLVREDGTTALCISWNFGCGTGRNHGVDDDDCFGCRNVGGSWEVSSLRLLACV